MTEMSRRGRAYSSCANLMAIAVSAVIMAAAALAAACSAGVVEDVKQAIVEARQSAAPTATLTINSASPAKDPIVNITFGGTNASYYLVNESATPPSKDDPAWTSVKPGSYTLNGEGLHSLYAWVKSVDGTVSAPIAARNVILDTKAPVFDTFALGGATTNPTQSQTISLTIAATDENGIAQWYIKEGASAPAIGDTGWSADNTTPTSFQLSSGSGTKAVYAYARDAAGNIGQCAAPVSVVFQDSGTAPTINGFALNTTDATAASKAFTLTATNASAYLVKALLASDPTPAAPSASDGTWATTVPTSLTLSADGSYVFYAWAKNEAGQVCAASTFTATYDHLPPTITTFSRTSAATVTSASVQFQLDATDTLGVTQWLVVANTSSTAPTVTTGTSGWTATKPGSTDLGSTSNTYYIYAFARDAAGNISAASSFSVVYTNVPNMPQVTAFTRTSSEFATSQTVTFSIVSNAYATGWIVKAFDYGATPSVSLGETWSTSAPASVDLPNADGAYTVCVWSRDYSGQIGDLDSFGVTLDRAAPTGVGIALTGGSTSPTSTRTINLAWSGTDATSGIADYYVSESSATPTSASAWLALADASSFTLSSGSVDKTLYAWARDKALNISSPAATLTVRLHDPTTVPAVTDFTRTSAQYSSSTSVSFSFASIRATKWIIKQVPSGTTPADPDSAGWTSTATSPSPFTLTGADGAYDLYAWVKNDVDQVSASQKISVTLDTTKPTFAFSLTSASPTSSPTAAFSLAPDADLSGIDSWVVKVDSTSYNSSDWVGSISSQSLASYGYGSHTIYAWARDRAMNVSASYQSVSVGYFAVPVASLGPSQGTAVSAHERIVLTFSESMNTGTVSIPSGELAALWAAGNVTSSWASYNSKSNAQLTIAPKSSNFSLWPTGSVTLSLAGSSADGIALGTTSFGFSIANRVYVHSNSASAVDTGYSGTALDGNEASAGTMAAPMATLQYSVDFAKLRYSAPSNSVDICVAGNGSGYPYASNYYSTGNAALTMRAGISVYGGYSPSNWNTTRNPSSYITFISDTSSGYTSPTPNRAVTIGDPTNTGIDSLTRLDGCSIQGASVSSGVSPTCSGIVCGQDSGATISNCTINGSASTGPTYTYGIFITGSSAPIIINSTINGGRGNDSYGIYMNSTTTPATTTKIIDSSISSGYGSNWRFGISIPSVSSSGTTSVLISGCLISAAESTGAVRAYAVNLMAGSKLTILLFNNVIIGGNGDALASNASMATGIGVYCYATSPTLINNTICSGTDSRSEASRTLWPTCIYIRNAAPTITNNYLFCVSTATNGCGIYEYNSSSRPAELKNNAFSVGTYTGPVSLIYYRGDTPAWFSAPTSPSGALWDASLVANVNGLATGFSDNIALSRNYSGNGISSSTGARTSTSWPTEVQGGGVTITGYPDFPQSGGNYIDKAKNTRTASWTIGAFEYD